MMKQKKKICVLNTMKVEGRCVGEIRMAILIIGLSIRRHEKNPSFKCVVCSTYEFH